MQESKQPDDESPGEPGTGSKWSRNVQLPGFDTLAGLESTRYLGKWLLIGSIIGIIAGLGAVVFTEAIGLASQIFLGRMVGYAPPLPLGEGLPILGTMARPWMLPIVTALGGLLSGLIVFRFAPSAEGHGTDAAIEAIIHNDGRMDPKVPPVKLVASAITIGSGGSAGREGPAAQISTGFASLLSDKLNLSPNDRRIAASAGLGAGIGSIFRAPLGGALMSAEILYLHDIEVEVLVPSMIAAIVGYSVYGAIEEFEPIFGQQSGVAFHDPTTLGYFALLGVLAGLMGLLYAKCFYGTVAAFHKFNVPIWIKPAIGGFFVGLLGLFIKGSIGTGYGWIQISMTDELLSLPLWIVLALPFAKILATSFTVGSGGSGGIFGPGMVVGGMLGASFWRLGHDVLPNMPDNPVPFVIVGMIALFGSIAHAPLAMMLMVAEMTGNLSLLAPAMIALAVAMMLVGDHTIYTSQVPNRASSPAHRLRSSFPLLAALTVRNAFKPREPSEDLAVEPAPSVSVDVRDRLDDAMLVMADADANRISVVESGDVIGELTYRDALTTYRSMIDAGLQRVDQLPGSSLLMEFKVGSGSAIVGQSLRAAGFPPATLVVSVSHAGKSVIPSAATMLLEGDLVTVLGRPEQSELLKSLIEGDAQAASRTA